jgi:hypothetical protein
MACCDLLSVDNAHRLHVLNGSEFGFETEFHQIESRRQRISSVVASVPNHLLWTGSLRPERSLGNGHAIQAINA